jgi:hypothetical protein
MTDKPLKRPRDPAQRAKLMIDIASGEVTEDQPSAKQARARKAGTKGGPARAKALSPEQRSEIARVENSAAITIKLSRINRTSGISVSNTTSISFLIFPGGASISACVWPTLVGSSFSRATSALDCVFGASRFPIQNAAAASKRTAPSPTMQDPASLISSQSRLQVSAAPGSH